MAACPKECGLQGISVLSDVLLSASPFAGLKRKDPNFLEGRGRERRLIAAVEKCGEAATQQGLNPDPQKSCGAACPGRGGGREHNHVPESRSLYLNRRTSDLGGGQQTIALQTPDSLHCMPCCKLSDSWEAGKCAPEVVDRKPERQQ